MNSDDISSIHKLHPIRFNKLAKQEEPRIRKIKRHNLDTINSKEMLNGLLKTNSPVHVICSASLKHSKIKSITKSMSISKIFRVPSITYKKSNNNSSRTLDPKINSSNNRVYSKDLIDSFKNVINGQSKKVISNRKVAKTLGIRNKEIHVLYCSQDSKSGIQNIRRHRSPNLKSNINRRKRFELHNSHTSRSCQSIDNNYGGQLANEDSKQTNNLPSNDYIIENEPRTSDVKTHLGTRNCALGQHYNLVNFPSKSSNFISKKKSMVTPCLNILLNEKNIITKPSSTTKLKEHSSRVKLPCSGHNKFENITSNTICPKATALIKDKCLFPTLSFQNNLLKMECITNVLKCILFTLTVIIWSPCIIVMYLFWAITYPLRPTHFSDENYEKSNKSTICFPGLISFKWTPRFFDHVALNGLCPKFKHSDKNGKAYHDWKQYLKKPTESSRPRKRFNYPKSRQCYTLQYDHKGGWVLKPTQSHIYAKKPQEADVKRSHSSKLLRNGNHTHKSHHLCYSPNKYIHHIGTKNSIRNNCSNRHPRHNLRANKGTDGISTNTLKQKIEFNVGDGNKIPYKNCKPNIDREFRSLNLKNKHIHDIHSKAHRIYSADHLPHRLEYLHHRSDHLPHRPSHIAWRSGYCRDIARPYRLENIRYKLHRIPSSCYAKKRKLQKDHSASLRKPSYCHFKTMHNIPASRKRLSICKCRSKPKHKFYNECRCKLKGIKKLVINTKNRIVCAYRESEKCTCDEGICDDFCVSVLRNRPCYFIYNWCPSFYPYFVTFLQQCKTSCYIATYLCSVCVWVPIFVCYYIGFLLFCKCCCED